MHVGEIVPKGEVEWRRHPETVFVAPFPFGTSCIWGMHFHGLTIYDAGAE